jgi:hypothetical protein
MSTITNATTPTVVSFEVLLAKMNPHFKFFAKRVLKLKADNLDDALQELRAIAFDIYRSLIRRGKQAFYTPIMNYAIKRYNSGRRFAGTSTTDVLSDCTRILERCDICSLDTFDLNGDLPFLTDWRQPNVADTVQFKIDFEEWHYRQSPKDQQIIGDLAMSETTNAVAKKHGVSASLISIKRKDFANSWKAFIDPPEAGMLVPA